MTSPKPRPHIRPLPERLINKIAAGEVVERPASVVKELVENSLDAGATRIEIIIEKSGTRLIKIVDNGCGIPEDQIEIAFSRHATSKLSELRDLDRIMSYGFRGEALPSIASVSRMRMVSRSEDAQSGIEIIYEGGVLQSKKPVAAAPGTIIEVENLFFNTPARRKFLKAETTEARHISRTAMALALGRHDVGFTYSLNGRRVFVLPPEAGLRERVPALLAPGKKFVAVSGELGPVTINGFISPPDLAQSNRYGQFIFVNGRYIQSTVLSHAFAAGYGELLPRGNFPIGALLLTVEPTEIDVNVHPAKTEIRLSREREIHDAVYRLVKEALRTEGIIPAMEISSGQSSAPFARDWPAHNAAPPASGSNRIPGMAPPSVADTDMLRELYGAPSRAEMTSEDRVVQVDTSTGEIVSERPAEKPAPHITIPGEPGALRLIGRLGDLYLLFQSGNDLMVVDQHTAHERVLFEEMMRRMDRQGAVAQQLLMPVNVELNPEQMAVFDEAKATLTLGGFGIEEFGGCTLKIEAVPAVLSRRSPEKAVRAVLDDVASLKKSGYDLRKAVAQSIACRSAVMAGDRLNDREAEGLAEALLRCENAFSCPHGRPTFVRISREHLDRQFGRG